MAFQLSIYTDGKFSPTQATEDSFLRAFLERKEYGPGAADHLRQHAGDRREHRAVFTEIYSISGSFLRHFIQSSFFRIYIYIS